MFDMKFDRGNGSGAHGGRGRSGSVTGKDRGGGREVPGECAEQMAGEFSVLLTEGRYKRTDKKPPCAVSMPVHGGCVILWIG